MSPADAGPGDVEDTGRHDAPHGPARRIRCESCFDVLQSRHPWDTVGCGCGSLTVSGPPWRPAISWLGHPGSGWSDVTDLEHAGGADPPPGAT